MKNVFSSKLILVFFALAVTFSSCKKDREVEPAPVPDLATRVSGNYIFSELAFDGRVIPADQSNLKGDIKITRKSETEVNAVLDIRLKSDNEEFMAYDVSGISLKEESGSVDLIYEGEKVAEIKGKKIIINGTDDVGVDFVLTATR